MKAARSFETSRTSPPTTQRYAPADLNPEPYHCDKLEFPIPCYITLNRNTSGVKRIAQMAAQETTELEWYVWNQGFGSNRDDEGIRQEKFPPVLKETGARRIGLKCSEMKNWNAQTNAICCALQERRVSRTNVTSFAAWPRVQREISRTLTKWKMTTKDAYFRYVTIWSAVTCWCFNALWQTALLCRINANSGAPRLLGNFSNTCVVRVVATYGASKCEALRSSSTTHRKYIYVEMEVRFHVLLNYPPPHWRKMIKLPSRHFKPAKKRRFGTRPHESQSRNACCEEAKTSGPSRETKPEFSAAVAYLEYRLSCPYKRERIRELGCISNVRDLTPCTLAC
jgi:hypothetical protein